MHIVVQDNRKVQIRSMDLSTHLCDEGGQLRHTFSIQIEIFFSLVDTSHCSIFVLSYLYWPAFGGNFYWTILMDLSDQKYCDIDVLLIGAREPYSVEKHSLVVLEYFAR